MIDLSTLSLEELVNIKNLCESEITHREQERLTELKNQLHAIAKAIATEFPNVTLPSAVYDEECAEYIDCDALEVLLYYFQE